MGINFVNERRRQDLLLFKRFPLKSGWPIKPKIKSGRDKSLPLLNYLPHQFSDSDIHIEVSRVDYEKLSCILKLARKIADLAGSANIQSAHLAEALHASQPSE